MKTAEVEAEIKRRTRALKLTYGKGVRTATGALEADFRSELSEASSTSRSPSRPSTRPRWTPRR
jgi:hypothetical protein